MGCHECAPSAIGSYHLTSGFVLTQGGPLLPSSGLKSPPYKPVPNFSFIDSFSHLPIHYIRSMTVAHLGDSSSLISNKPSHSSVGPASQQLPSQVCCGLQSFQGPGRTTVTPITQRRKLRHRKTQYRCVESGFKSRPATVSRKKKSLSLSSLPLLLGWGPLLCAPVPAPGHPTHLELSASLWDCDV